MKNSFHMTQGDMVIHDVLTIMSETEAPAAELIRENGGSQVLLVCEHASNMIPESLKSLGLSNDQLESHIAYDPGAFAVANHLSTAFDARFVASRVSRLVYDCNRPFEAEGAMPRVSEIHDIPGNVGLSDAHKLARRDEVYQPFHDLLAREVAARPDPILVTMHSFTPIYKGQKRDVELGILHNKDTRFSEALMSLETDMNMQLNEPYGPSDAVMHTVETHAEPFGHHNVMIEVANNLIATEADQKAVADELYRLLSQAIAKLGVTL